MNNKCENCGSSDFTLKNGFMVCKYCGTRLIQHSTQELQDNGIALDDDVSILLNKCRLDPKNARKYANLILDIDPTNEEALDILNGKMRRYVK